MASNDWMELCEEQEPNRIVVMQACDAPIRVIEKVEDYGNSIYRCADVRGEEVYVGIPDFRADEAEQWDSNEYHLWKRDGKFFTWSDKRYIKK